MQLLEKFHLFPGFYGELRCRLMQVPFELACLKTAPAL
jgi:hypothetical protein